jgi:hypothetical protein
LTLNKGIAPEEEEATIKKVAEKIHKYGLDVPSILVLESFKPFFYIGGELGLFLISPLVPIIGDNIRQEIEKFIDIFEKHDNIDKLIKLLEQMSQEEPKTSKERHKSEEQTSKTEKNLQKRIRRLFLH